VHAGAALQGYAWARLHSCAPHSRSGGPAPETRPPHNPLIPTIIMRFGLDDWVHSIEQSNAGLCLPERHIEETATVAW
jgi:hypothetical protein